MSVCQHAAVVGLGLIGGSVARDLSARGVRVAAYDADRARVAAAAAEGIVNVALDASLSGVADAEIIVIAVPVNAAVGVLARIAAQAAPTAIITDVGSTKASIVDAAVRLGVDDRFVGSHPMAGDHRSGWAASRTGLFSGACVYLCPPPNAAAPAIDLVAAFWRDLGGWPTVVAAAEHDHTLAWASHLPHVVSAAVALALSHGGIRRQDLGPGGKDVTRLAGSSPEVWTAIVRDNAASIVSALDSMQAELVNFRTMLAAADDEPVRRRFADARAWFDE